MAILTPITPHFLPSGTLLEGDLITRGHINRTYVSVVQQDGATKRYVHQLINTHVFRDPVRMMDNIRWVIEHLAAKRSGDPGLLHLLPNDDGEVYFKDDEGNYWRTYNYVEGSTVFDIVPSAEVAYEAAVAFGKFLHDLSDLDAQRFHITIPDFHHTPRRIERFKQALAQPVEGRTETCQAEIEFVLRNEDLGGALINVLENHPETIRVTHNDTKVNNVLFCEKSLKGMTVIDLDTVMPGSVLFDVGDLIRTACNSAAEDEQDLSKVQFDFDKYAAIVRGFAETIGDTLHPAEWDAMASCGAVITLECGIRFLTDYLDGDKYFRIHRDGQNLDRARTQFHLVQQMIDRMDEMKAAVNSVRF